MACLGSIAGSPLGKCVGQHHVIVKLLPNARWMNFTQTMFISSKHMRDKFQVKRPAPFPYKTKKYGPWAVISDSTSKRFDENTKLIVVEGNIAAGKTTFAKELATKLDMQYVPEVTTDLAYMNEYGHDVRDYAHLIPKSVRPFDISNFYKTPNDRNVASFQLLMYRLRFFQYIDALAHIFNTGEGVVLERCAFSDAVFVESMAKFGYISRQAKNVYYMLRKNTITELLRPHLVIYLDAPVDVLEERIKKRGLNYEVDTNVLNKNYLLALEEQYKNTYLKEIEKHSELAIYDWSEFGEVEEVIEDIERMDLDSYGVYDLKMQDWRLINDSELSEKRFLYTSRNKRALLTSLFAIPCHTAPELLQKTEDMKEYLHVFEEVVPGNRYQVGYNADVGDTGILFKTSLPTKLK